MTRPRALLLVTLAVAVFATGCGAEATDTTTTTATTAPPTETTEVEIEGTVTTDTLPSDGPDDDLEDDPIVVTSPAAFDVVVGSFTLAGTADVFEANVNWEIVRDENSPPVHSGYVTATCGTGCRGTFSKKIQLAGKVKPGSYTLLVYSASAKDGSHDFEVPVPLTVHATK